jgi:hypothetical protein
VLPKCGHPCVNKCNQKCTEVSDYCQHYSHTLANRYCYTIDFINFLEMCCPNGKNIGLRPHHDIEMPSGPIGAQMPTAGAKSLAHLWTSVIDEMLPRTGRFAVPRAMPRIVGLRTPMHGHLRKMPSRSTPSGLCPGLQAYSDLWPFVP